MAKLQLPKSATEQTVNLFVQSPTATDGSGATGLSATTSGLQMFYVRSRAAAAAVTLVTATGGATQGFTSGLLAEISATGMKGWYRFDPPDAALASGVDHVGFHLSGASSIAPLPFEIQLTDVNLNNGVNAGLTAFPTATIGATGGLARRTDLLTATNLNSATNLVGLATMTATDVLTQAKQGLQDYNLHKWIATAATATDVVDDSLLARLVSSATTASFAGFVNTTDSLQAIRDRGDAAWTTAAGFSVLTATDLNSATNLTGLATSSADQIADAVWQATATQYATATNHMAERLTNIRVDAIGDSVITASSIANNAINGAALASNAVTEIAAGVWQATATLFATATNHMAERLTGIVGYATHSATDLVTQAYNALNLAAPGSPVAGSVHDTIVDLAAVLPTTQLASFLTANGLETGFTMQQGFRLMLSALAGKVSGATSATMLFRDINDSVNRISVVVDGNGNRTGFTYVVT